MYENTQKSMKIHEHIMTIRTISAACYHAMSYILDAFSTKYSTYRKVNAART